MALPEQHLDLMARKLGRKPRVIFASTATIYGLPDTIVTSEDDNIDPITEYDLHKAFAEQQLDMSTRNGVLGGVALRLANVYGPSSLESSASDRGILNQITKMAFQGKDLTVYGDGSQTRSFCHVDDLVSGLILLLNSDYQNPVNLGNPEEFTILELATLIRNKLNPESEIIFKDLPVDDPVKRCPDIKLAKKILSWSPKIKLAEGLKSTIEWFKKT